MVGQLLEGGVCLVLRLLLSFLCGPPDNNSSATRTSRKSRQEVVRGDWPATCAGVHPDDPVFDCSDVVYTSPRTEVPVRQPPPWVVLLPGLPTTFCGWSFGCSCFEVRAHMQHTPITGISATLLRRLSTHSVLLPRSLQAKLWVFFFPSHFLGHNCLASVFWDIHRTGP